MKSFMQLVINPGSTSTKIAVFKDLEPIDSTNLRHSNKDLSSYSTMAEQFEYRRNLVMEALENSGVSLEELDSVIGRGGLLKPIPGGTYLVNENMMKDLRFAERGSHASNLGGLLAHSIADILNIPAFIVDPVCIDEMEPIARISGMPENPRESLFHALNQKEIARRAAEEMRREYDQVNLVVAHLGGGISVGAHLKGRVIDVNNAVGGEGPFSPERTGGIPAARLVELCFSGQYTEEEMLKRLVGNGGLVAYLGTNDAMEVENRIRQGEEKARLVYEAMAYQVAKEIGACSTVLKGSVDAVVITGGLAHSEMLVGLIIDRISFIAPVKVFPGEDELKALAAGGLRVLAGIEEAKNY